MNYLIVDDHPRTRQSVKESLSRPGDTFHEASTGEEAVDLYDGTYHDWVIMDIRMPGAGGLAATTQILAKHAEAKIVVMSQFEGRDIAEAARRAGARAFLSKENIANLTAIISSLLQIPSSNSNPEL